MNTHSKWLLATFAAALLSACAATPRTAPVSLEERLVQKGYYIGEPVERIREYRINGWNNVDRRHVILTVGASEHYLVSLRNPCDGLETADRLAFSTTVGSLTDFDRLYVTQPGGFVEHCLVDGLFRLHRRSA